MRLSVAFVSIIHTLFPPTPSLWAAHISTDVGIRAEHADGAHHEIIAAAATALVISGIIPLAVWAFFRFNAKRAVGPLILWASLAVVFCYFMYVGSSAEFHQSPEAITTTAGRADFIRGIVDSCAERRRGNPQMPTPFMETEFWEDGRLRRAGRIDMTRTALEGFGKSLLTSDEVVIEATANSMGVSRVLEPFVARVIIANPLQVKAIAQAHVKTDKIDAGTLASLQAAGYLPQIWTPDASTERKRRSAARRYQVVRHRTRLKNEVHSILHAHLIPKCPHADTWYCPLNHCRRMSERRSIGTCVSLTGLRKTWPYSIARSRRTQLMIPRSTD